MPTAEPSLTTEIVLLPRVSVSPLMTGMPVKKSDGTATVGVRGENTAEKAPVPVAMGTAPEAVSGSGPTWTARLRLVMVPAPAGAAKSRARTSTRSRITVPRASACP